MVFFKLINQFTSEVPVWYISTLTKRIARLLNVYLITDNKKKKNTKNFKICGDKRIVYFADLTYIKSLICNIFVSIHKQSCLISFVEDFMDMY